MIILIKMLQVTIILHAYGTNQLQLKRDTQAAHNKNHAKLKFFVCLRVLSEVLSLNFWIIDSRYFKVINSAL